MFDFGKKKKAKRLAEKRAAVRKLALKRGYYLHGDFEVLDEGALDIIIQAAYFADVYLHDVEYDLVEQGPESHQHDVELADLEPSDDQLRTEAHDEAARVREEMRTPEPDYRASEPAYTPEPEPTRSWGGGGSSYDSGSSSSYDSGGGGDSGSSSD